MSGPFFSWETVDWIKGFFAEAALWLTSSVRTMPCFSSVLTHRKRPYFFVVNDHINDIFFLRAIFFGILLQGRYNCTKEGVGLKQPGSVPWPSPLPGLFLNNLGLALLDQNNDQDHEQKDEKSGVEMSLV